MTHIYLLNLDACMDYSGIDKGIVKIWECGGGRDLAELDDVDLCN